MGIHQEQSRIAREQLLLVRRQRYAARKALSLGIDSSIVRQFLGPTCAICGRTEGLALDHDHVTGVVRGNLCRTCNTGLGSFRDNLELLEAAKNYLIDTKATHAVAKP